MVPNDNNNHVSHQDRVGGGIKAWGESPFPPTLLATLITAQHMQPFKALPMIFPPVLLFVSYSNLQGFKIDSAGINATWSGLYLLLASRGKNSIKTKPLGARGIVRLATIGVCLANVVGGGLAYMLGKREREEDGKKS